MRVFGVDLAGPSNLADTAMVGATASSRRLRIDSVECDLDDRAILDRISTANGPSAVGLDAPLSYNPGGGLRPSDRALREALAARDLSGVTAVMPPTFTRMAYLTLRGIAVARAIAHVPGLASVRVVEVHPGAAMALAGAEPTAVRAFKLDVRQRRALLRWLLSQGVELAGVDASDVTATDHHLAACAVAFGTWRWLYGRSAWCWRETSVFHPFEFAC